MTRFTWVLHDEAGTDLRTTEAFQSKAEAEAWMGAEWSGLSSEGAESVSLLEDDKTVYTMSLREA